MSSKDYLVDFFTVEVMHRDELKNFIKYKYPFLASLETEYKIFRRGNYKQDIIK